MTIQRRIGVLLPRDLAVADVLRYARRADELGFDELWVVEDLGFRGGVAQAAAVLASTQRIAVGIGILPAGARNAAFAAMELGTLGQLFPGRVIAGIGHGMPGWMRSVGAWPASPLTLLGEHTTAVRSLLRGATGGENGRYVSTDGVVIGQVPDVVPPVVLGVRGPKSLALAGRVADGVLLAEPAPPSYIRGAIAHVTSGATERTDGGPTEVITYDVAAVDDDAAAARARVRPGLAWIGEPDWTPHLAGLSFAEELAAFRAGCADPDEFGATMPDAWIDELALAGTPADVRAKIAERHDAGATSIVLAPIRSAETDDRLTELEGLARVLG